MADWLGLGIRVVLVLIVAGFITCGLLVLGDYLIEVESMREQPGLLFPFGVIVGLFVGSATTKMLRPLQE